MQIKQFEDKSLSHFSYAIMCESEKKIILIDPERNPEKYYDYAKRNNAKIVGVIETHPHADFVSSHLEIHQNTGVTLYTGALAGAAYPYNTFDEGDIIQLGEITLSPLNTPGHSPDSISIVLKHAGKQKAVFTGDTLFIGDCGRPDLREDTGNIKATKDRLARQMYHSLREKLMQLPNDVLVYPAHGAGTLCGKSLSEALRSTIGAEKLSNWSLQQMSEDEFVQHLLADQPFVPAYFPYNVELNRTGALPYKESIDKVKSGNVITNKEEADRLNPDVFIVDGRSHKRFGRERYYSHRRSD